MAAMDLLAAFGASAAELEENRAGRLSTRQATELRAATGDDAGFMAGFAIVLAVVMYGILVILVRDGRFFRADGELFALGAIVLMTGVLPTAALAWAVWTLIVHKRTVPRCEMVEGVVEKRVQRHRAIVLHELAIGEKTFVVNERAHARTADGARYRVYFVPLANVVVSMEPV